LKYSAATAESGIFADKNRERTVRDHDLCKCTAKIEFLIDGSVIISRVSEEGHDHDLDSLDQYKRNDGLWKSVQPLIWRGISTADIYVGLSGVGIYGNSCMMPEGNTYKKLISATGINL